MKNWCDTRIEEDEAQHWCVAGVALLHGLQPLGEARTRQIGDVQFTEQSVVIGTDLLVDLDPVALDGDPVPVRLGMLPRQPPPPLAGSVRGGL